jgi:hypothetical protein
MKQQYYARRIRNGSYWHVICPSGIPLYDDEPHGKDKPVIFDNEDDANECAALCNMQMEMEGQPDAH